MRRIVLNEDLPSLRGLHPECHAQGLIPYCKENPRLRVERRVSIWNVVVNGSVYTSNPPSHIFGRVVALWIVEAHDLAALGMPAGSFSLLLDGDPIPEHSTHLFQTVLHRDVAWQLVIAAWQKLKPQALPIEWNMSFDDLPEIMRDIALGKSNIRCNFDPGWPVDFRPIFDEHRGSTRLEFKKAHNFREPRRFDTVPPLPDFRTLHYEVILGSPCPPMTQREIEREQEELRVADRVIDDQ
ncbi:hypothetical protein B0T11DRAFT_93367 [Plectosphaerella cucumerina]|uniref:Uncharacterized protein n=1 Tax=Plectosphaerella cucumerina TaxID=40658 RepID=A0A8K0TJP9_9PEZI|nr:hypothetical protein B0T11DRAFT_93367 [Plectosphaerella cucumerina]